MNDQNDDNEPANAIPDTAASELPGVFAAIGALPAGAIVTEEGLAERWFPGKA